MSVEIKPFLPADAIILTGDRNNTDKANHNQTAGPAFSLFIDDKLVCCGGLRVFGTAEAWFLAGEDAKTKYLKEVIKACKEKLEEMQRQSNICTTFAICDVSENFLEHLKFEKKDNIFVR